MRTSLISIITASSLAVASCTSVRTVEHPRPHRRSPEIRVLLESGIRRAAVIMVGKFKLIRNDGQVLLASGRGESLVFSYESNGILVRSPSRDGVISCGEDVLVAPGREPGFKFGNVSYPGKLRVVYSGGELNLINIVPVEKYLECVIPVEIGAGSPEEFAALEAQAVAARTYAYSRMLQRQGESFDVHDDVEDQVYGGERARNKLASEAAGKTSGLILEYQGSPADAYYCANCGGHTADVKLMWPDRRSAPYLSGILDRSLEKKDAFCSGSRYFRWRYSYSGRELGEIIRSTLPNVLRMKGADVGRLIDINVIERSPSGRVAAVAIRTTRDTYEVRGDKIRWVFLAPRRARILPSTMFSLHKILEGRRLVFISITGGGNGHGMGMCQAGALEMAREGYTFRMILSHYYPGCKVTSID